MIPVALFVRVSSEKQNYQRQLSDLRKLADREGYEVVATITAKISTLKKDSDRTDLTELLQLAKSGRIQKVLTTEISRLGRDTVENLQLLDELSKHKVSILSQDMGMETLTADGKLSLAAEILFTVYSSIYRQEREKLRERILSGQQEAKRQGKHIGRRAGTGKSDAQLLKEYAPVVKDLNNGISLRKTARIHGLSPATVQKVKHAASAGKSALRLFNPGA
jgi:DNA invertase Pin-like site-specific DNA recombinase